MGSLTQLPLNWVLDDFVACYFLYSNVVLLRLLWIYVP